MNYQTHKLGNGIKVVHYEIDSAVAHFGVLLNVGSRDELEHEQGIAHFIEHTIFKGTKKRKAYHVLSRLEDVGGELNAYTTKEETAVYATFLREDYHRTIELISDIIIHSNFPVKELEKEKEVVIEEINSYKDSPSELIFDEFEELIFDGHPIARNILGTPELVKSFTQKHIKDFMQNNYHTNEMVICSVGKIKFERLVKLLEKYFSEMKENIRTSTRLPFTCYTPQVKELTEDTYQSHCMLGNIAYHSRHKMRLPMVLLNNILGGTSMNSRLNMALRERNGMAYNIESNYTAYTDTGIFNIYFGTDPDNLDRAIQIVNKEMNKLRNTKLGSLQLSKAKKQLIGQLAVSQENKEDLLLMLGKTYMLYDRIDTLDQIRDRIEAVDASELMEAANEIFNPNQLSTLIIK
ncbi:insulinase family protein [Prolixibacteraceae bacterium JC049]|nr:insulinase family protein [Prolixibacteraceae bacterium JC049]